MHHLTEDPPTLIAAHINDHISSVKSINAKQQNHTTDNAVNCE